jgi:tetratricopeptide (TPR) repeat protein
MMDWLSLGGRRSQCLILCVLFLLVTLPKAYLGNNITPARLSNEELLSRADRAFLMRNFLASEKYYRELNDRLAAQLSSLTPSGQQEQIEIAEELILAPFGLGHSLIYLHRYAEAREILEKGLRIYPDWAKSHVPLTFFQDPLFTGPVLNDLKERMQLKEDEVPSLVHGYIQFFGGNLQEADQSFSRVLSQDPGNFMAKYFADYIKSASKRQSTGIDQLKSVDPETLPVDQLIDYGSSFFKNANYSMAAKLFKRAIDIDHRIPVVHIAYGDSLFALGRFDEATQAILKGLEIYPKYAEGAINRRDFYSNPSEFDLQLRNLENYVTAHPSNQNARFLLGYNYFFTQDYAKAEEQLKAVLSNKTLYSSAQFLQGLIQKLNTHRTRKDL